VARTDDGAAKDSAIHLHPAWHSHTSLCDTVARAACMLGSWLIVIAHDHRRPLASPVNPLVLDLSRDASDYYCKRHFDHALNLGGSSRQQ
jgi:hypothetical protein